MGNSAIESTVYFKTFRILNAFYFPAVALSGPRKGRNNLRSGYLLLGHAVDVSRRREKVSGKYKFSGYVLKTETAEKLRKMCVCVPSSRNVHVV